MKTTQKRNLEHPWPISFRCCQNHSGFELSEVIKNAPFGNQNFPSVAIHQKSVDVITTKRHKLRFFSWQNTILWQNAILPQKKTFWNNTTLPENIVSPQNNTLAGFAIKNRRKQFLWRKQENGNFYHIIYQIKNLKNVVINHL